MKVLRSGASQKKKRFTEEQIIGVLKEAETGMKVPDLAREHDISFGQLLPLESEAGRIRV